MATDLVQPQPQTLPITVEQYRLLVDRGTFDGQPGQIELIHGRVTRMNPQGPLHSDPIDELEDWSHEVAGKVFRIRIEKPIEIIEYDSSPEPDVAWVIRRRYADHHPTPDDIQLLIEVSESSQAFDRGEKLRLYASSGIVEYWIVDVNARVVDVFTEPRASNYAQSKRFNVGDFLRPKCLPEAILCVERLFSMEVK